MTSREATSSRLSPAAIVQNAYVVRDLDAACVRFHERYHVGPFVGGTEFELGAHRYRGRPEASVWVRGVFVQVGPLNVELIQVLSEAPSAFHDMFPSGEEGLHHVAMFCDDYECQRDAWVAAGYPVASEFTLAWGPEICYVDARREFGHMIELYPQDAVIQDMYQQARDAARGWDGSKLVIPWA